MRTKRQAPAAFFFLYFRGSPSASLLSLVIRPRFWFNSARREALSTGSLTRASALELSFVRSDAERRCAPERPPGSFSLTHRACFGPGQIGESGRPAGLSLLACGGAG